MNLVGNQAPSWLLVNVRPDGCVLCFDDIGRLCPSVLPTPAAVHYQMLMYAYASTSSGGGVEVEVDAPDLPAVIATTASYGHGAHPDGPSSTSRGCTWAYILDEVR
mmetsp:Transcript_9043/g.20504  ORF Transcript_9043/g.20504 Transcript_9043/m.20504 type:complete len:106 (+) Transcript_9043:2-319(+)